MEELLQRRKQKEQVSVQKEQTKTQQKNLQKEGVQEQLVSEKKQEKGSRTLEKLQEEHQWLEKETDATLNRKDVLRVSRDQEQLSLKNTALLEQLGKQESSGEKAVRKAVKKTQKADGEQAPAERLKEGKVLAAGRLLSVKGEMELLDQLKQYQGQQKEELKKEYDKALAAGAEQLKKDRSRFSEGFSKMHDRVLKARVNAVKEQFEQHLKSLRKEAADKRLEEKKEKASYRPERRAEREKELKSSFMTYVKAMKEGKLPEDLSKDFSHIVNKAERERSERKAFGMTKQEFMRNTLVFSSLLQRGGYSRQTFEMLLKGGGEKFFRSTIDGNHLSTVADELMRTDDLLRLKEILDGAEDLQDAAKGVEDVLADQYASYDKKTKTYVPGESMLTTLDAFRQVKENLAAGEQPDLEALRKELTKQLGFSGDDLKSAKESDLMKEADSWFSSATKEEKQFLKGLNTAMSQSLKTGINSKLKKSIEENNERGNSREARARQEARIMNALVESETAAFKREWQAELNAREEKTKPALAAFEKEKLEQEKKSLKKAAKAKEAERKEQGEKAVSRFLSWKSGSSTKEQELPGSMACAFVMSKGTYTAAKFKKIMDASSEGALDADLQKDIRNAMIFSEDMAALKNSLEKAGSVEDALNALKTYFDRYRTYDAKTDGIREEQSPLEQAGKLFGKRFSGVGRFFTKLREDIASGSSADLDGLDDVIGSFMKNMNEQMDYIGGNDAIKRSDAGKRMRSAAKLKTLVKHSFRYQDDLEAKEGSFITEEKKKEQEEIEKLKQKAYEEFDEEWKTSGEARAEELAKSREADIREAYEQTLKNLEEDEQKAEEKLEELKEEEGRLQWLFDKFKESPTETAEEFFDGAEELQKYVEEFRQKNEEGDLIGFVREFRLPDAMKEKMDEYLSALYGEAEEQAEEYAKEQEEEDEDEEEEEQQTLEDYVKEKAAEQVGLSYDDGAYTRELYNGDEEGVKTKEKGYSTLFGQDARTRLVTVKGKTESSVKAGMNEDWELLATAEKTTVQSKRTLKTESESLTLKDTTVKGATELGADVNVNLEEFRIEGSVHAKYQGYERTLETEVKDGLFKGSQVTAQYSAMGVGADLEFIANRKKFSMKAEAEAHLAKGEVNAKFLGQELSLSGEVLSAEASAKAKVDYRKRKLKAKADLSANLIKGEAKTAFSVMGVKINVTGEAGVGVGGSAELKLSRKKIKAAANLAFGLEMGGKFEVDLSSIEDPETLDLIRNVVSGTLDAFERTAEVKEDIIKGRYARAGRMNQNLRRMGLR